MDEGRRLGGGSLSGLLRISWSLDAARGELRESSVPKRRALTASGFEELSGLEAAWMERAESRLGASVEPTWMLCMSLGKDWAGERRLGRGAGEMSMSRGELMRAPRPGEREPNEVPMAAPSMWFGRGDCDELGLVSASARYLGARLWARPKLGLKRWGAPSCGGSYESDIDMEEPKDLSKSAGRSSCCE